MELVHGLVDDNGEEIVFVEISGEEFLALSDEEIKEIHDNWCKYSELRDSGKKRMAKHATSLEKATASGKFPTPEDISIALGEGDEKKIDEYAVLLRKIFALTLKDPNKIKLIDGLPNDALFKAYIEFYGKVLAGKSASGSPLKKKFTPTEVNKALNAINNAK